MKEFKGTKGKWSVFKKLDEFAITTIDEMQAVCFMPTLYTYSEANAKLIESAPEMFNILNKILDYNISNDLTIDEEIEQLLTKITE